VNRNVKRSPHVHLPALVVKKETPSLVAPLFSDIHITHDFQAIGNSRHELGGEIFEMNQYAVLSQPHPTVILQWFNVNIAGIALDGRLYQLVDQRDDGVFIGG